MFSRHRVWKSVIVRTLRIRTTYLDEKSKGFISERDRTTDRSIRTRSSDGFTNAVIERLLGARLVADPTTWWRGSGGDWPAWPLAPQARAARFVVVVFTPRCLKPSEVASRSGPTWRAVHVARVLVAKQKQENLDNETKRTARGRVARRAKHAGEKQSFRPRVSRPRFPSRASPRARAIRLADRARAPYSRVAARHRCDVARQRAACWVKCAAGASVRVRGANGHGRLTLGERKRARRADGTRIVASWNARWQVDIRRAAALAENSRVRGMYSSVSSSIIVVRFSFSLARAVFSLSFSYLSIVSVYASYVSPFPSWCDDCLSLARACVFFRVVSNFWTFCEWFSNFWSFVTSHANVREPLEPCVHGAKNRCEILI